MFHVPQPVSPDTTTTLFSSMALRMVSFILYAGKFDRRDSISCVLDACHSIGQSVYCQEEDQLKHQVEEVST